MMSLLEKAGLVRRDEEAADPGAETAYSAEAPPEDPPEAAPAEPALPIAESTAMSLEDVYAAAAIPPSPYPAERLMRLIDGLKEMSDDMRRRTIEAIDAADDSWTIADPLRDARAKIAAIDRHLGTIRAGIAQAETEAGARIEATRQRSDGSIADIRRQIAELEGLLAREVARGAEELAAIESTLRTSKDGAHREIDGLSRAAGALQGLVSQFDGTTNNRT
jgi:ABC-type transporter Mla subunit MlaD